MISLAFVGLLLLSSLAATAAVGATTDKPAVRPVDPTASGHRGAAESPLQLQLSVDALLS